MIVNIIPKYDDLCKDCYMMKWCSELNKAREGKMLCWWMIWLYPANSYANFAGITPGRTVYFSLPMIVNIHKSTIALILTKTPRSSPQNLSSQSVLSKCAPAFIYCLEAGDVKDPFHALDANQTKLMLLEDIWNIHSNIWTLFYGIFANVFVNDGRSRGYGW